GSEREYPEHCVVRVSPRLPRFRLKVSVGLGSYPNGAKGALGHQHAQARHGVARLIDICSFEETDDFGMPEFGQRIELQKPEPIETFPPIEEALGVTRERLPIGL